jgi:hypothetical protein
LSDNPTRAIADIAIINSIAQKFRDIRGKFSHGGGDPS